MSSSKDSLKTLLLNCLSSFLTSKTDSTLNTTSTNPIQNKIVTSALAGKMNNVTLATIATSGSYSDLKNTPTLANVATSGSYNDLSNKPTIPAAVTVDSAVSSTSTNPLQNKAIYSSLSSKVNASGSRGTLSGYEDVSSGSTVTESSPDSQTSSSAVTVSNGTSGTSWTKIVLLTSAVNVTLGSNWNWVDDTAPTIVANGILVCCWCGSKGIANFLSPSA